MTEYAAYQWGSFLGLQCHPEIAIPDWDYGAGMQCGLAELKRRDLIEERYVRDETDYARFVSEDIKPAPGSALIIKNWFNMIASGYFKAFRH